MKFSKEIKIALLALLSIGVIYWGVNFLKGKNVFKNNRVFYAVYDNTEGLMPNRSVTVNGYKVGMIEAINMKLDNPKEIVVRFSVEYPIEVPENSIARIYSIGLLGEKQIELVLGDAPITANNSDTLVGIQEAGLMDGVNEKLNPIVEKTDLVLGSLNTTLLTLLDDTNQKGIRHVIANLDTTTAALSKYASTNEKRLSQTTADIAAIASNLKANNENISLLLKNLSTLSDAAKDIELVRIANKLETAIEETNTLLSSINAGEGTLGKLANDPQLYDQLTLTSYQLNRILVDLEQNPKRYINVSVFGKRAKPADDAAIEQQIENNTKKLDATK